MNRRRNTISKYETCTMIQLFKTKLPIVIFLCLAVVWTINYIQTADNAREEVKVQQTIEKLQVGEEIGTHNKTKIKVEEPKFRRRESCLVKDGPKPVILMTLGRSGSGSTWQMLGGLSGSISPSAEYTGSDSSKSKNFFAKKLKEKDADWILKKLCKLQREYPKKRLVGFKWKPYKTIFSKISIAGLKVVAELQNNDPPIKIVRSRRNLLDVIISRTKHKKQSVPAHCSKNDVKCLKKHAEVLSGGINLSTEKLLREIETLTRLEDKVDQLLLDLDVPHIQVEYEKLYTEKDANEWKKILVFLNVWKAKEELKWNMVEKKMEHASTSPAHHKASIENFEEVKEVLTGTNYGSLIHRRL